jgi:hypothetical protein
VQQNAKLITQQITEIMANTNEMLGRDFAAVKLVSNIDWYREVRPNNCLF